MKVQPLLDRLQGVRQSGAGRWLAKCPAHEDRSPSLSVRELDDGTVLINDFGGCSAADVIASVGLEFRDLFPARPEEHFKKPARAALDARDVLSCLALECEIVAIAANDIANGSAISPTDADRIAVASGRILSAWQAHRGHR